MIQIIASCCTQQKFRDAGVDFYSETKFYDYISDVYIAPCPRHPLFLKIA